MEVKLIQEQSYRMPQTEGTRPQVQSAVNAARQKPEVAQQRTEPMVKEAVARETQVQNRNISEGAAQSTNVQSQGAQVQNVQIQNVQTQNVQLQNVQMENAQEPAAQSQQEEKYRNVMAEKAVENANNRLRNTHTDAKFAYNKDINRITITITDRDSNEVIREIPSEETQKMLERLHTLTGVLMDEEV